MKNLAYKKHLIHPEASIYDALNQLNQLGMDAILIVTDESNRLTGSLTDGDVRRGMLKGAALTDPITSIIQANPRYLRQGESDLEKIQTFQSLNFRLIPVVDENNQVVDIINLRLQRAYLPVHAVLMAGGRGQRLMPLTADTPKPMLHVGEKPIIEHNIERLKKFGVRQLHISVNYKADVIRNYFQDGSERDLQISYVQEDQPLGTCGSMTLINDFSQDYVLLMNSDLLTDIDFADFFKSFQSSGADMAVAATGYEVDVPYAVLEIADDRSVRSLKEKPRYTFYSNAGIYLMKKELLNLVPKNTFFNITDLMEMIIADPAKKLITYPLMGYWLDIGKHEDFKKAQEDIKHLQL